MKGRLLDHPWGWLATGCGSGLVPWMPGTVGSLAALPLAFGLLLLPLLWQLVALALLALVGWRACDFAIARLGSKDPGCVVVDEWLGLLACAVLVQALAPESMRLGPWPPWPGLVACLLVFRFFDIVKPWPVCWLDRRLPGGLGVMADDLAAGLLAGLTLLLPGWLGWP